jgi:hypothetical protein
MIAQIYIELSYVLLLLFTGIAGYLLGAYGFPGQVDT